MEKIYEHLRDLHVKNVVAYAGSDSILYKDSSCTAGNSFTRAEISDLYMKGLLLVAVSGEDDIVYYYTPVRLYDMGANHHAQVAVPMPGTVTGAEEVETTVFTVIWYYSGEYTEGGNE